MTVSIELIKKLRDMTGVSMTACKSALEESNGDLDQAIDVLRKKGEAKAADRAVRETSQGAITVKIDGEKAAITKLECETDFVSMGDDFAEVGEKVASMLLNGEISEADRDLQIITEAGLKMGENIKIGEMKMLNGGTLGSYVHSNKKIGVVVQLEGGNQELAKDIAMHIAATSPVVISPEEISNELVEKEKEIWKEQLAQEGKTGDIVEKIMLGKEKKFREENALLKQQFVKNPDQTVEDLVNSASAKVLSFTRYSI